MQAENPKRSCVWFHRVISGLNSPTSTDHPEILKYIDERPNVVNHSDEANPQTLLHTLKNKKMKEVMDIENIFTYDATWTPKGTCTVVFLEDQLIYLYFNGGGQYIYSTFGNCKVAGRTRYLSD